MSYQDVKPHLDVEELFGEKSTVTRGEFTEPLPTIPQLPLIHITDGLGFRDIINSNSLQPGRCKVFQEDLLYLSYGRPVFRVNSQVGSNKQGHNFPVCIILETNSIEYATRIFPFDSGAFDGELFQNFMHKKFKIGDFALDPNPSYPNCDGKVPISIVAPKIVEVFYENNTKYYKNTEYRKSLKFDNDELCFEAKSYYSLIKSEEQQLFDDRRSTIEIQTDNAILLSPDIVSAVVLPGPFLDAKIVENTIFRKWHAEALNYTQFNDKPSAFIPVIRDIIGRFFIEKGFIGKI
jgi:hypothetical protein